MTDDILLYVKGKIYGGWKEATVTRNLDAIAGKFDLVSMDKWETQAQRWTIFPGDECKIVINGQTLITGYVDKAGPNYDAQAHGIKILGRDKTADLVDCSAIVPGSELNGLTLQGIAAAIAKPFGIKVNAQVDGGPKFPSFAIQPAETAWEAIERAARQRFMVVTTDGLGALVIADIGKTRANDALMEGQNIKAASAEYDYSQRFSQYIVKGQAAASGDGWEPATVAVESKATDPNVKRYRPKIIMAEVQASDGSATNRAQLEAASRAGKSTKITVTVQGWTQSNGELWPLNSMVRIRSPLLSIDQELLISETKFIVSSQNGITTELQLTRPDAYLLGQAKVKKDKKDAKTGIGPDPWDTFQ
ncbi:phage baseplate assembly protein [Bradyrhizobium sp.]|uniref:phage baseplate assembly protein n=1 Tax=Bradyrhizobium sp. TaxID=376 RepID=UPI0039E55786